MQKAQSPERRHLLDRYVDRAFADPVPANRREHFGRVTYAHSENQEFILVHCGYPGASWRLVPVGPCRRKSDLTR